MPITVSEKFDSGELTTGDNATLELRYIVRGTASMIDAAMALGQATPPFVGALVVQDTSVEPISVDAFNPDASIWEGRVRYCKPEKKDKEPGQPPSFEFNTSGGTQHITQSLATIGNYDIGGGDGPNFKGAIGVTADSVEGVDITVPVYEFSETHVLADATVTAAYKGKLFALTGKINNADFKGCKAGECLFLGASGSKRGDGDWEISFKFAASPNKTNLQIGDFVVPAKKGWEYLWVRYEDKEDLTHKMLLKRPRSAHVEKVYEEGDFSELGIGT